tara:strand:+ start:15312 stop:16418 length:1107 start_codon:yes stop_codon:yes gene_type:complete
VENKVNFFDYDRVSLEAFFSSIDEPSYRARQVFQWVHRRKVINLADMTDLSVELRHRLSSLGSFELPKVVEERRSQDGTIKWLTTLWDGNIVETVLIPEVKRNTLCISSQAGCALKCAFCATGRQGFSRNLSTSEIIGQLWLAEEIVSNYRQEQFKLSNIVMMGMGEPLLNYSNVVSAMKIMLDDFAYGLSRRRVTLSTAGVVPGIDLLGSDCPVSLAVSLHAADDNLRSRLVPLNKKYPISVLLNACRRYSKNNLNSTVTFEYILLKDVNDSESDALKLTSLLGDLPSKVNLIPYNQVEGTGFMVPNIDVINKFRMILNDAGIITITRKTRGSDIDAACGQLAGRVDEYSNRQQNKKVPDEKVKISG